MINIELLGPSALGKSTFLDKLVEVRNDSSWITDKEGYKSIMRSRTKFVEKSYIKAGKIFGIELQPKKNVKLKVIKENDPKCSLIMDLFLENLSNNNHGSWRKIKWIDSWLGSFLDKKLMIYEEFRNNNLIIVYDEGFIQNGGLLPILNNFDKYKDITACPLFPNGVIFFDLDLKTYRERIHSRFKDKGARNITNQRVNVTDEEIEVYMVKAKENARKNLEICKRLNLSILELEPFTTEENINKAFNFINHVKNKNGVLS